VWSQDSSSVQDQAETGDQFGAALAGGTSFDGDAFTDLAIGAPGEEEGSASAAGGVNVLYGSSGGLNSTGNQFWAQDSPGIADKPQDDDAFGGALTGGSLDDDNFGDLVVGVPGEEVGGKDGAGSVSILFGTSGGLSSTGNDQWTQDSTGIRGKSEVGDGFGSSLRTGKLNGDGIGDLAIGNPGEDVLTLVDAGEISVLFGSASGPNATGDQVFNQNSDGILGTAEAGDALGTSLKAGNFQGDSFFDVAVGVPGESVNGKTNAGQINVLFGATNGLSSADDETWQQDKNNIDDSCETGDSFGFALS
jgi:hypothetical protein